MKLGTLYLDDGESLDSYESGTYNLISYLATSTEASGDFQGFSNLDSCNTGELNARVDRWNWNSAVPLLSQVKIFGVTQAPRVVMVNGANTTSFSYDSQNRVLTLTQLSLEMRLAFAIKWSK